MDCTLRPLRREEVPRILPLIEEAVPALRLTPEDVERNLWEPGSETANGPLRLAAARRDEIFAVACASLRPLPPERRGRSDEVRGHIKLCAVRPELRRHGVGTRLLEALEARLVDSGARRIRTGGAAPIYLQPGVPSSAGAALALFRGRDYRDIERRRSITVRLGSLDLDTGSAERSFASSDGLLTRRAKPSDASWLPAEVSSAFSADWAEEARHALESRGALVHVVLRDAELAGFAVAALWARNAFGPMGTLPDWRGKGVGSVLLKRCLSDLRARGESTAVISWVGPETFYRRCIETDSTLSYVVLEKVFR